MTLSTKQKTASRKIIRAFLLGGMLAATLDGLAAIIYYLAQGGENPAAVFKFIASGVFCKKSF